MSFAQITEKQHPLFIFAAVAAAVFLIVGKKTLNTIRTDFKNKKFVFLIIIISLFSYVTLKSQSTTPKEKQFKEATKKAITALSIAYLAHLDLVFAPFFLIFAIEYYLSSWV